MNRMIIPRVLFLVVIVPGIILGGGLRKCPAAPADGAGLVGRWTFDDSLQDDAGEADDDLTALDTAGAAITARFEAPSDVAGISGKAVALGVQGGDAQYLVATASDDVMLGPDYTIEAWIHPTQLGQWNRLVLVWGQAPNYAYHLALHDGRASLFHGQADGSYVFAEGGQAAAGRWYHLVGVARRESETSGTLEVYLNGRRVGTAPFDGTIAKLPQEKLGIGDSATFSGAGSRFCGYLDELAIWDRALSADEIRAGFNRRADMLQKLELAVREKEAARRAELLAQIDTLGVEEIVFAERGAGRDPSGHYYANFGYSCINPDYWIHGGDGGRLCKLNLRTGELTALVDDPDGAVRDPDVHYDGRRILFSYRPGGSHHYNLFEIDADGGNLRQITDGAWDDVEPVYLPDGDVVFCSTRCNRYIGCWLAPSATLFRCTAAGENPRMISSGSFTENTPAVLPDGRVLYTRWEYVNRDPVSFHHLWTINPDGSGQMVFFGNMHPGGVFIDARPIPGTSDVVLINSPGHGRNEHAGYVATLSTKAGPDRQASMRNISASADFRDPYAISPQAFLAARGNQILLLNDRRETEVLYTAAGSQVHEPRALRSRPRERALPRRSDLTEQTATVVLSNVYSGRSMQQVPHGAIKRLLVMEDLPKPANYHGGGSQPIGHGVTSTLKRVLGTVPVEPDGSAHFEVPAMRSVYFAALDENDVSLKQMRSFVTLQPGETLSCVGCHEPRTQTPANPGRPALEALSRDPSPIEPIADVPSVMDFPRDVQPVLDRHCVECHNHQRRDGGIVLTGDRGPVFSLSYYGLLLHWQIKDTHGDPKHGSGRQPGNDRPYTTYSSASALMEKIDGSHYDVELTPAEHKTVRLWIDSGAQFPGTYAAYGTGQVGGCWGNNEPIREMADQWPSTPAARDAVARRCGSCHAAGQLPDHVTARLPLDPWGDMLSWQRPLSRYSRHRLFNLTHPERSLVLLAALSKEAGGYATAKPPADNTPQQLPEDRSRPPQPIEHPIVFTDTDDPGFQAILTHIEAAGAKLDQIKRFDMPGFRPSEHYVREMQRFEVLPPELPADTPIDVYATDAAYWRSFWHRPRPVPIAPKGR